MCMKNNPHIASATESFFLEDVFLLICRGRIEYLNDIKNRNGKDLTSVRPPSMEALTIFWKNVEDLLFNDDNFIQVDLLNDTIIGMVKSGKGET